MSHCVPDWSMEDDYSSLHAILPPANQRKSTMPEHELVELLWQNGHVVMHSQTHRKTMICVNEIKQCQKPEATLKCGGTIDDSTKIADEEGSAPWLQFAVDDSLEKEFYSDFYGLPTESRTIDKIKDATAGGEKFGKYGAMEDNSMEYILKESSGIGFEDNVMPPPNSQVFTPFQQTITRADAGHAINYSQSSRTPKTDLGPLNGYFGEKVVGNKNQGELGKVSSVMTKGSSASGSNQVHDTFDVCCCSTEKVSSANVNVKEDAKTGCTSEGDHNDTHETTITSSSGGLRCSFAGAGQHSTSTKSHKRKGRDADESECLTEEAEYETMDVNRPAQRPASARRSRAAEVHNLAERRRRDRINEKMKALQELIPHCNKSDKASMLDEAIEYLKSLQLQLQMMWMGSNMAAMMLPGVQHYMSRMVMGIGHGPIASVHAPMQLPRVPLVSQSMPSSPAISQASMCPTSFVSPVNVQNQMQSAHMPESYAHFLGFHQMQPSPQAMNMYSSQLVQQNQAALAASGPAPCDVAAPSENVLNIKTGQGKT